MDRTTVFTKTTKGLMEATGKTSQLSRDMRAVLKEVDGKATVELLQARLGKLSEAKLQEALETLSKGDYVREFSTAATGAAPGAARTAPPPSKAPAASGEGDLDFTMAIPTAPSVDKRAEEAAKQAAQAAAAAAEARAKAEAAARAKAAAEAAARAKAEAEAKARAEAAARAKAEAEAKARAEAAARAKAEVEARAKREAEERARREAEEKARREADELRAKLEQERKAREEAERKAKEEAERERREAEEKARREADELRAKLEEERKAREEAERKAKEEAERQRREAEEKARREADELRAKLEQERKAREEAERRAKEEAERRAKEEAERRAREDAERKAKEEAERARREAEEQARRQAEERAREEAERKAREEAERTRVEAEERASREADEQARRQAEERAQAEEKARVEAERAERRRQAEAEERARQEAETQARKEAEETERRASAEAKRKTQEQAERERREIAENAAPQPQGPGGSSLEDMVKIETDFDAVLKASAGAAPEAQKRPAAADDELRKAAEDLERRQADEQAAAEAARVQAQAEAEQAAEARRKDEAQARQAPEPAAVKEQLPEYVDAHAEAQALLDAQNAETERHFADMEKELEAEQTGAPAPKKAPEPTPERKKKEAKESARAVAAAAAAEAREAELEFEPAPEPYRPRINWGKPVALGLFLLIVLGLVLVNFISFDGSIPQFEKAAGAYLQQPVKIKSLHLSLVPRPHWRLDGVSVGNEGQLKVARVNAIAELGSMFGDKKAFSSIELESPVLGEPGLLGLLFGKPAGRDFRVASIIATNAKLESKTFILPALDAKIALGEDGAWQKIALETPDHKTSLTLKPEGEGAALDVETNAFSLPFHPSFILENFVASGQILRNELRLKEFKGGIYDGYLSGNASLKWGADWSLSGEVNVRAMDPARFVPALLEQGKLEGKAAYSMRAKSYDELYEAPRLEGTFDILKGNLLGVDLGRMLQGGGAGGKTAYAELTGGFVREAGRTQLRQINLVSGPVSAGGSAEVDAAKRISGRFAVELKSPVAHARANLTLSGTLQEPHFNR